MDLETKYSASIIMNKSVIHRLNSPSNFQLINIVDSIHKFFPDHEFIDDFNNIKLFKNGTLVNVKGILIYISDIRRDVYELYFFLIILALLSTN